jgi:predicted amidohydrolase YtcJ
MICRISPLAVIVGTIGNLGTGAQPLPAEYIVTNAAVYTVGSDRSLAQAIAVRDGRLVYVGTADGVERFQGPSTRMIDARGRMVLPGFHDAHIHPLAAALERDDCDVSQKTDLASLTAAISRCATTAPMKPWIVAFGWKEAQVSARIATSQALDKAVPDRPVVVKAAYGGQSIWVNSRALRIAGVTVSTPDPTGGSIERDAVTRGPTGIFRGAARRLVMRHMPALSAHQLDLALRDELRELARLGVTGFHDAYAPIESLETYQAADRDRRLTALVRAAIPIGMTVEPSTDEARVSELRHLRRASRGSRFAANAVKIHVDGMIDLRTAALLRPYEPGSDTTSRSGLLGHPNYSQDRLNQLATLLDHEGFQLHIHAVGDRAVRMALDALEAARRRNGSRDARHIVAHVHLIERSDATRFARLGAVAGLQPILASDQTYLAMLRPLLGSVRVDRVFPLRSMSDAAARVAAGSDAPDSSGNPLESIQAATRQPREQLTLGAAIAAHTIAGAWQDFLDGETGSLEVGKRADFIVLDRNLFEIPSAEIHSARVLWTVVGGQEVYCAENWDECPAGATRHDRQVQGAINELVKTSGWDRRCVRGGVDAVFDRLGTNAFQVGAPIRARRRPDTCIGREHTVHPSTEHHLSIQEDTDRERREEWRCGVPMGDPRAPGNTDRRPEPLLR